MRYAKDEVYANVLDRMKKICEFTAAKYDCKIEMSVCNECRAVINDDNLYQEFKDAFVAENVSLEGTVRYAKDEVYANVLDRMKKICEFTAAKYDCKIEMSVCKECRAVINDDNLYQEFKDAFKGDNVVELDVLSRV